MGHCRMLHDFQENFKAAVLDNNAGLMSDFLCGETHVSRMSIYRNNIFVSLINVLFAAFPKTSELVGANNFQVLAKNFVEKCPPDAAQLSGYGAEFADFLSNWPQIVADIPYLPDLAKLDWVCQEVYFETSYLPVDANILQGLSPEELFESRLSVAPSVRLLKTKYPISHFGKMDEVSIEQLSPETEYILVYRLEDTEQIITERLHEADFLFLENLKSGQSLGNAFLNVIEAHPSFDLQNSLTQLLHKALFMS